MHKYCNRHGQEPVAQASKEVWQPSRKESPLKGPREGCLSSGSRLRRLIKPQLHAPLHHFSLTIKDECGCDKSLMFLDFYRYNMQGPNCFHLITVYILSTCPHLSHQRARALGQGLLCPKWQCGQLPSFWSFPGQLMNIMLLQQVFRAAEPFFPTAMYEVLQ